MQENWFGDDCLKQSILVFRAINNKLRQRLLQLIHEHKEITVNDLSKKVEENQSVISQHLGILRDSNIVLSKRDGNKIFYSINHEKIKQINETAALLIIGSA